MYSAKYYKLSWKTLETLIAVKQCILVQLCLTVMLHLGVFTCTFLVNKVLFLLLFLKRIVTGDETWIYEFHMQTTQQASEWRLPTELKPKNHASRSKVKIILTVFFKYRGYMHSQFLPEGQTVNNII
jgi:uncharacterized membrane protein YqaE (UPF0057 family)